MPNKKPTKNKITTEQQLQALRTPWAKKRITVIALVLFLLWLISDIFIGGNVRFYGKWLECGQKPVVSGITYETLVPYYEETSTLPSVRLNRRQFCSPHQAELNGYSANKNQYDFPHLHGGEKAKSLIY